MVIIIKHKKVIIIFYIYINSKRMATIVICPLLFFDCNETTY